jgi:hypothetical protein
MDLPEGYSPRDDRSNVRLLLPLACLAPGNVEAIVRGEEPSGPSLERLAMGVPRMWEEPTERFGFPAR